MMNDPRAAEAPAALPFRAMGRFERNPRRIAPKHYGKPAIIRDQRTRPVNNIYNPTKSAKPQSPVQVRTAPPITSLMNSALVGCG
jgi:hypothetical protein